MSLMLVITRRHARRLRDDGAQDARQPAHQRPGAPGARGDGHPGQAAAQPRQPGRQRPGAAGARARRPGGPDVPHRRLDGRRRRRSTPRTSSATGTACPRTESCGWSASPAPRGPPRRPRRPPAARPTAFRGRTRSWPRTSSTRSAAAPCSGTRSARCPAPTASRRRSRRRTSPTTSPIRTELFIDEDTARAPRETTITTRVFLRNQNRPPSAKLTATYSSSDLVTLNASDSLDPENNPLYYRFLDGTTVVQDWSQQATFRYRAKTTGSHAFSVIVRDIGGLQTTSNTITVTCASTPINCTGPTS